MSQRRVVDFDSGVAMVVTDLHGEGAAYFHLRETFLKLRAAGQADRLVICGDLIHGYSSEDEDDSLNMLVDVMRLRDELGENVVTMLLGNHEMPHIYSIMLSKGHHQFTPRFEQALARLNRKENATATRDELIIFLKSMPFYARTKAGVTLSHAGASPALTSDGPLAKILDFSHDDLLAFGDQLMQDYDMDALRANEDYRLQVMNLLAVKGVDDPRFTDWLRGLLISHNNPDFSLLWDTLFTMNEMEVSIEAYDTVVEVFLQRLSAMSPHEQRVIVAGHIGVKGGYKLIGERHLRLASYAHAHPPESGHYLMLDCEKQVETAKQLVPHLHRIYGR